MKKHEQYSVGIYCRQSKDEDNDSTSIASQKLMFEKYVRDNVLQVCWCGINMKGARSNASNG